MNELPIYVKVDILVQATNEESKIRYLEIIQEIVARMSHNSFLLKSWAITLTSAEIGFMIAYPPKNNLTSTFICIITIFINFVF